MILISAIKVGWGSQNKEVMLRNTVSACFIDDCIAFCKFFKAAEIQLLCGKLKLWKWVENKRTMKVDAQYAELQAEERLKINLQDLRMYVPTISHVELVRKY